MLLGHIITLVAAIKASSSTEPYLKSTKGLYQLNDWLDDNVDSEDPRENFAAVLEEFAQLPDSLLNRSKVVAVKLLRALEEAAEDPALECTRAHLELIRVVQKSSHAHSTFGALRINKVLRPYTLALAAKCDQLHEREFERIHSACAAVLRPLENIVDENFIESHRKQFGDGVLLHFREDHFLPHRCCSPAVSELAQVIRLNSIKLNADERSPSLIAPLVGRRFERNLSRLCAKYVERLGDTFELATSAAYFDPESDFHFIAKRSRPYQNAVFRYKFCQDALAQQSNYIAELTRSLIEAQAPADAGGK